MAPWVHVYHFDVTHVWSVFTAPCIYCGLDSPWVCSTKNRHVDVDRLLACILLLCCTVLAVWCTILHLLYHKSLGTDVFPWSIFSREGDVMWKIQWNPSMTMWAFWLCICHIRYSGKIDGDVLRVEKFTWAVAKALGCVHITGPNTQFWSCNQTQSFSVYSHSCL